MTKNDASKNKKEEPLSRINSKNSSSSGELLKYGEKQGTSTGVPVEFQKKTYSEDDVKKNNKKLFGELENKVVELEGKFNQEILILKEDIKDASHKADDESSKLRTDNLSFLAIFTSLFTFISVEFQIFKNVGEFRPALAISLVLLGGLGMFISVLLWSINKAEKNSGNSYIISLLVSFVLIGLGFVSISIFGSGLKTDTVARLESEFASTTEKTSKLEKDISAIRDNSIYLQGKIDGLESSQSKTLK